MTNNKIKGFFVVIDLRVYPSGDFTHNCNLKTLGIINLYVVMPLIWYAVWFINFIYFFLGIAFIYFNFAL